MHKYSVSISRSQYQNGKILLTNPLTFANIISYSKWQKEDFKMDKIVQDFGTFIKEKRIARGLSQGEVAKLLGISQAAYCRYENGLRDPGLNMVKAIAKVLKFKPGEFFDNYRG